MTTLANHHARGAATSATWITWLRWLAVLPAATVLSSIVRNLLGGVLAIVLGGIFSAPSVANVVIALIVPFFESASFVMAGSIVAPRARVQTAWVLTGLSLILGVVGMIVVWSGIEVGWIQVTVRPPSTGWGMAMATASGLAGLLLAVHFVRKGEERRVARSAL